MQYTINLDHDTSALYAQLSHHTGMTVDELVNRQLNSHHMEVYEMLALADAHPELGADLADLFRFNGPEPLSVGVKRIAPPGYLTLTERFEHKLHEPVGTEQTA